MDITLRLSKNFNTYLKDSGANEVDVLRTNAAFFNISRFAIAASIFKAVITQRVGVSNLLVPGAGLLGSAICGKYLNSYRATTLNFAVNAIEPIKWGPTTLFYKIF